MKALHLFFFLTVFLLGSNELICQGKDTLNINSSEKYFNVLPHIRIIKDQGKTKDINTVMTLFNSGAAEQINSLHAFNPGYNTSNFWFRLIIKNNGKQKEDLILNTASIIDTIIVYKKPGNEGVIKIAETGIDHPYLSRIILNRNFLVPMSIEPDSTVTYFLLVKNGISTTYIPFSLQNSASFFEKENSIYLVLGLFCGLLWFVIIFNLCLYLFVLEKIHLFYAFYVFSSLVFLLMEYGVAYEFGLKYFSVFKGFISEDLWWLITLSLWLYVMQLFLNQKKSNSKFYKITKCIIVAAVIRILFLLFLLNYSRHFYIKIYPVLAGFDMIVFFLAFIVLFGGVIEKIYQGFTPAKVYLLANSFGAFGAFYLFSNSIGLTSFKPIFPNVMTIGLTIEIIILTLALAYRYFYLKKEKSLLMIKLERQQTELSIQLIQVQEEERKRIAEDLHDDLGSNLAAIKLRLQKSNLTDEELGSILNIIDKASEDTRNIAHNLMPPEFEKTDFHILLSNYYSKLNSESKVHFHFHCSATEHHFSKNEELVLYRIITELTSNILKHAEATDAAVQLIYYEHHLDIMVEDNGKGLGSSFTDGIGIKNVQSRVSYLKGELKIDTGKLGTTIMIRVPYTDL